MVGPGDTSTHGWYDRYITIVSQQVEKHKNPTPDRVGFLFLQSFFGNKSTLPSLLKEGFPKLHHTRTRCRDLEF
jgi:hypothetical protein